MNPYVLPCNASAHLSHVIRIGLALGCNLAWAQEIEHFGQIVSPPFGHSRIRPVAQSYARGGQRRDFFHKVNEPLRPESSTVHVVETCADDDSPHSLRVLVAGAGEGDTIDLTQIPMPCSKITLDDAHAPPHIAIQQDTLYLVGPGRSQLTIDANFKSSIFRHAGYDAIHISGMTIANGMYIADTYAFGGCVYSTFGNVYLRDVEVTNCTVIAETGVAAGGGIYSGHDLRLDESSVTHNRAINIGSGDSWGGGINSSGSFTAANSTISTNVATSYGNKQSYVGGALIWGPNALITTSTIDGNRADIIGGIDHNNHSGDTQIVNSTISGNYAQQFGGMLTAALHVNVDNSTIAANRVGGPTSAGVYLAGSALLLRSSIVAANVNSDGPADIDGSASAAVTGSNNLVVSSTLPLPADTLTSCPQLEPLLDNGGTTRTHALRSTSPSINAGNSFGLMWDQRGLDRVFDAAADIGAFEWHGEADERLFAGAFDSLCDE